MSQNNLASKPLSTIDCDKKAGKRIVISGVVTTYANQELIGVDIRRYYRDRETGEYAPTRKGIFLTEKDLNIILTELGFDPSDLDAKFSGFLKHKKEGISMLRIT